MANISLAISWMQARQGKVRYSMTSRQGPNSYDCSSAVFYALRHAGFPHTSHIGNTETLFGLQGKLLTPINRANGLRAGDVFVSGRKGGSANAYGHTGFALNATEAIHCSSSFNGIGVSSNSDSRVAAYGGAPVYWYRVIGSGGGAPDPTPDPPVTPPPPEVKDIYINSVNGDLEYYIDPTLKELVGTRITSVDFQDVTGDKDLLEKGKEWLQKQPLDLQSITADVAQLHEVNPYYKTLRMYDVVTVDVDTLNIDVRMRVDSKSFTLEDKYIGTIDFGRKISSVSDLLLPKRE